MKRKILIFGTTGQIGWELHRSLASWGEVRALSRTDCSISQADQLEQHFAAFRPTHVVNAAAFTAVDNAEIERTEALALNVDFPVRLAELSQRHNSLLVDYSTDYVFDGMKPGLYSENDGKNPLNFYGLTKLKGLQAIDTSGCRHLVFRVTWVYSARRKNFLKTIFRLAQERDSLSVVDDQIGAPTSARWIAEVTCRALDSLDRNLGSEGVFNLVPTGHTSWWGFAKAIVEELDQAGVELKIRPAAIRSISTAEFPTPAIRPANSRLENSKILSEFGFEAPPWHVLVPLVVAELLDR